MADNIYKKAFSTPAAPPAVTPRIEKTESLTPIEKSSIVTELKDGIRTLAKRVEEIDETFNQPPVINVHVPDLQKVHVENLPEPKPVEFPDVQKVEVTNPVDIPTVTFPDIQKVEITNPTPTYKAPTVQKVEVLNPTTLDIPIGKADIPGEADPERYVPVRLTNGKKFYSAMSEAYTSAAKSAFPFVDSNGKPKAATVDNNGALQTDIKIDTVNLTVSGTQQVMGDSPSQVADSGANPVKVGGTRRATFPSYQDGQRSAFHVDENGLLLVRQGQPATISGTTTISGAVGITDGSSTVNVLKSDGSAAGQNALKVANATQVIPFTTSTPGAQTLLANTDVSGYAWIDVVLTSVGVSLAWQGVFSPITGGIYNNCTTWTSNGATNTAVGGLGTANNTIYSSSVRSNFFQLNVTALTSGTLSGYVVLSTIPRAYQAMGVSQGGAWTVGASSATGSAVPANAFYQGVSDGANLQGIRTPTIFKTATTTVSGNTAVWTPTTGKKFRLMGYYIAITGDCATASGGEIDVTFQDSTTDLGIGFSIYVPATSVTTNPAVYGVGFVSLGNGKLSAAANNVLNVNLSAALSSGKVRIQAVGTEE